MDFVSRAEWHASAPKRDIPPFIALRGLTIHHSASAAPSDHADCARSVLGIQHFQMYVRGNYDDIAYSWLVCPHGTIFEGRGWNHHDGANGAPSSAGYNSPAGPGTDANYYYPAACVLGNSPEASPAVSGALIAIREDLIRLNAKASEVWPHSHIVPDQCPGDPLRAWIAQKGFEDMALSDDDKKYIRDCVVSAIGALGWGLNPTGAGDVLGLPDSGSWASAVANDNIKNVLEKIGQQQTQAAAGGVDMDALANAVADKLAARLQA